MQHILLVWLIINKHKPTSTQGTPQMRRHLPESRGCAQCPMYGSKGGVVVRAIASHQCGLGSNPGVEAICGLSLLLVLSPVPRGFSPGTPVFPSP